MRANKSLGGRELLLVGVFLLYSMFEKPFRKRIVGYKIM